ncbi:MAG: response regulator, partial [Oligoflexia bacterium]|nr:response regulator [Oligoflexia bacterium]
MRALILEDNVNLAESLKQLISQQGLETRVKFNWETAFPLFQTNHFDIVVLDILLPDKKGFEILKILSEKNIKSKIALISGLFDEQAVFKNIPENLNLKKNCLFFKKPIDEKAFLEFIKKEKGASDHNANPFIESLFEKNIPLKPLNFYFAEGESFDSKQLIPIVFFAHLKQFTGELKIQMDSNANSIHFFKGRIMKIVSNSKKSFLGELLVEHGLSLQEDIELLLEKKDTNKRIGEQLVEKELLSPHMLNFILKEQVKIRLSEFMSHPVFKLTVKEKQEMNMMSKAEIDFNDLDFIEWLADSAQTELSAKFLNSFYLQIQNSLVYKSSQLNVASIYQKKFLKKYNKFFKYLKEGLSIEDIIQQLKSRQSALSLVYFGLLTKSVYLKQGDKNYLEDKALESFLDDILSRQSQNAFQVFSLAESASVDEINKRYKQMIRKIHLDSLPKNISPVIKEKAEQAVLALTESYENLKDESKRKQYIADKNKGQFLTVIDQYEKGLLKIKEEDYKTAQAVFLKIKDHSQAPGNTTLYLLWAQMKQSDFDLFKDKSEA